MSLTASAKLLARAAGVAAAVPGEILDVPVDVAVVHDNNGPLMLKEFERLDIDRVWDAAKVHFVFDHHSPATSFRAAGHQQKLREFARRHGIQVFPAGRGISHPVVAEEGLARPGRIVVGTDSHTVGLGAYGCFATGIGSTEMAAVLATGRIWLMVPEAVRVVLQGTMPPWLSARDIALYLISRFGPDGLNYTALEIDGPLLAALSVNQRLAIAVMGLEAGAKNVFMPPDEKVAAALGGWREGDWAAEAGSDAVYRARHEFDISQLPPIVAMPSLPTNGVPVEQAAGQIIHQATLGSCSGAYYHDLEEAAAILAGRRVHPDVRFIVIPNTSRVVAKAARTGVLAALLEAGAIISSPACGTCAAYEVGCLAPGEVCISTTTRNMDGRMGEGGAIYLAGARTVAASAVRGAIADPREFMGGER